MKKIVLLAAALLLVCSTDAFAQVKLGKKTINVEKVKDAASDVVTAVTLSDADVAELCRESVQWMDENNQVADETTEYGQRLQRLTANLTNYDGMKLNFKVYLVTDINAFASGDGSIRVFSALMDMMSDDELMAIIGHEIGHIKNTDVKDAIKTAYMTSAAVKAAGSGSGKVSQLTEEQLGEIVASFTNAQFSQKQENGADDYAFQFCVKNNIDPYAMALSLEKLVDLSGGAQASRLQKMFSSHPDSQKRATRMRTKADEHTKQ